MVLKKKGKLVTNNKPAVDDDEDIEIVYNNGLKPGIMPNKKKMKLQQNITSCSQIK